jgi:hypothetical protein
LINLVLGMLLGFAITISYVAFDLKLDINHSLSVNIVIAMATIIATAVHFDFQKKLRKDRIWDTNKTVLLELVHALSEVIEATEDEIHNLHCHFEGDEQIEVKPYVFKNIKDKVSYALTVYRPLMDENLIKAIHQHNEQDREVTRQVNHEDLENSDAYEIMLSEHKKLYSELLKFMGEISGVKNI